VPSPLSVTVPIEPLEGVANVTVAPPEVRSLPLASLSCTVSTLVPPLPAVRLEAVAVTVLVTALAAPGTSVIEAVLWKSEPSSFGVIVTLPTVVAAV